MNLTKYQSKSLALIKAAQKTKCFVINIPATKPLPISNFKGMIKLK